MSLDKHIHHISNILVGSRVGSVTSDSGIALTVYVNDDHCTFDDMSAEEASAFYHIDVMILRHRAANIVYQMLRYSHQSNEQDIVRVFQLTDEMIDSIHNDD